MLTGEPSAFWLVVSVIQTFVLIPGLVYFFGKGAYCGWICSCGALAETLGDDYRTLAPHGERAKRWEHLGQGVLLVIFVLTLGWGLTHWTPAGSWFRTATFGGLSLPVAVEHLRHWYELVIDVGFAGTISLGVYFFFIPVASGAGMAVRWRRSCTSTPALRAIGFLPTNPSVSVATSAPGFVTWGLT